jgi:radical SAM-linked protein
MVRQKLQIRFRKTGDLRLISHRDLARAFERLFRRAALPLAMSQGFHPHARINFPSALALGIQGEQELVEALLEEPIDEQSAQTRLVQHSPPGLEITDVHSFPASHPKPRVLRMTYQIEVPPGQRSSTQQAIDRLLACDESLIRRDGQTSPLNLRCVLDQLRLLDGPLEFSLRASGQAQAGPRDVLRALGLEDLETQGSWLIRTEVQLAQHE